MRRSRGRSQARDNRSAASQLLWRDPGLAEPAVDQRAQVVAIQIRADKRREHRLRSIDQLTATELHASSRTACADLGCCHHGVTCRRSDIQAEEDELTHRSDLSQNPRAQAS
ncbi:hypothetical protein [Haliangium sp. UPWRP_2]|uniref:hypothetical protein n=1 Tax=Haliangium sp. UPWRP_2 TaxID=1931276 RepID=UPI001E604C00|nr:hypothetical protein [Haliangium sp. UPWRP_2]